MKATAPVLEVEHLRKRVADLERELSEARAHIPAPPAGAPSSSEALLGAVLDHVQAGIVACDAEGVLTLLNQAAQSLHGLPAEPIPAERWAEHYDLYHLDGRTPLRKEEIPLFRALRDGEVLNAEMVIAPKGGPARTLLASGRAVFGANGEKLGAVVAMHDITERKRNEVETQERYRILIEVSPQAIWMARADGQVTYFNQHWYDYTGLSPERTEGHGWAQAIHPDHRDRLREAWLHASAAGNAWHVEIPFRRASDGEYRWHLTHGQPVRDPAGRVIRWMGTAIDIHERVAAAEALRESEARFRQVIDSMPQLVWSTRPDGYHDLYNRQWFAYTGLDYEDTKGENWNPVFHPDDQPLAWERWRHSLATGEPYEIEYRCRRHDGQYRWFLGRAEAIRGDDGRIVRWFGTCTDIHEKREAEAALRLANTDLESFAYAAAHDLQEPLRMVTSYTQLLQRKLGDRLDGDAREFMDYIVSGAKRTSLLLQDLLGYTEVSRSAEGQPDRVDLHHSVERSLQNLRVAIAESGARVCVGELPAVRGNEAHFTQLFQNLVGNAIKYRGERVPEIHVTAERRGAEWVVSVRDNGMGIDPRHHREVFGLFKRLHGRRLPGTGIGLAICQRVVERQGGRIWVESDGEGGGSTFRFSLPSQEPSQGQAESRLR